MHAENLILKHEIAFVPLRLSTRLTCAVWLRLKHTRRESDAGFKEKKSPIDLCRPTLQVGCIATNFCVVYMSEGLYHSCISKITWGVSTLAPGTRKLLSHKSRNSATLSFRRLVWNVHVSKAKSAHVHQRLHKSSLRSSLFSPNLFTYRWVLSISVSSCSFLAIGPG